MSKKQAIKENNDWIIKLIILISVLLVSVSFVVGLVVYKNSQKETKDFSDYKKSEISDRALKSILEEDDDNECYVFVYSKYSSRCNEIKPFIFQYLDSEYNSKKYAKLYLFSMDTYPNYATEKTTEENVVDVTAESLSKLKIAYFPTLFVIAKNEETNSKQIMAMWTGIEKIKSALSRIPSSS